MTKRNPHQHEDMRMLNVRVPVDHVERLRVVAEAEHRTVSQELRRLIELRIDEESKPTRRAAA